MQPGGAITAGNAATLNDGAAAAIIASAEGMNRFDLEPLARIVTEGTALAKLEARLNELKASVDSIEGQRAIEIEHMVKSAKRNASRANRSTPKPPNASNDSPSRDD